MASNDTTTNITTELAVIANNIYGKDIRMAIHDALKKLSDAVSIEVKYVSQSEYNALTPEEKNNPKAIYFIHKDDDETKSVGIGYMGSIFSSGGGSTAKASPYQPMYGMCIPNM